jgi:hypothetical protein
MTSVQNYIKNETAVGLINIDARAAANGMTREQMVASMLIDVKTIMANADCVAVMRNKDTALDALNRIATIECKQDQGCAIATADQIAAILA